MTGIFEDLPNSEEFVEKLEALGPTWESISTVFKDVIDGVNDALNNQKASHPELIDWLTFLVAGANRLAYDLIQEGSRMEPRQNFMPALIHAQERALYEMNILEWRK